MATPSRWPGSTGPTPRGCARSSPSGLPRRSRVGEQAAGAAFRIVQHAIGEPAFMRAMLPLLREAAERGELPPAMVATLEDRICVFEGRPQRYGTQYDWDADGTALVPDGRHRRAARRRRASGRGWPASAGVATRAAAGRASASRSRGADAEAAAWATRVGWR
ncbi:MAG: DUF6624 domain-containing protein [Nannocystaceae bacterium]